MTRFDEYFQQGLKELSNKHLLRATRGIELAQPGVISVDGRLLVDFSSNDYLGLARHSLLIDRAKAWTGSFGVGARASRLVVGSLTLHEEVEEKIARFKGTEAALLFATGWQANASLVPALARLSVQVTGKPALVFMDRLNHASLHAGCAAAGIRQIRFAHNDYQHLRASLERSAGDSGLRFIMTESVFSMDGDRADLHELKRIANEYGAFLCVDEAHATGVLGKGGRGLSYDAGGVDLAMGTFSKALGGMGAYIAGSHALCDWLKNTASGFVFSTALPPGVLGAIDAALDLVPAMNSERAKLHAYADRVRLAMAGFGLDSAHSSTQIIPVMIGSNEATIAAADQVQRMGIKAVAIRPPTVPPNQGRLRIALSAAHGDTMIDQLCDVLHDLSKNYGTRV